MSDDPDKSRRDRQIDDNLRRVYDEMATEDLPDRFHDLLSQLRQQNRPGGDDTT